MSPRKRRSRVTWRQQGGSRRAWADFRDFADVGGKREPLVPAGERFATSDPDIALRLALRRLEELEAALLRIAVNPPESLLGQLREDERGLARAVKRVLPADIETEIKTAAIENRGESAVEQPGA